MLMSSQGTLISVIVAVGSIERLKNLRELLESIKRQTCQEIETILVCDTEELMQRLLSYIKVIGLDKVCVVLNEHHAGASSARNTGTRRAHGEILAFLDDDVLLHHAWAEELIKTFEDKNVVGVTGCTVPLLNNQPIDWVPTEFLWVIGGTYWRAKQSVAVQSFAGMNFALRKQAFELAGMYNVSLGPRRDYPEVANWKRLGGEESELALRVISRTRKHIIYNPRTKAYHKIRPASCTLKAIIKRALHVGHNRSIIWRLSVPAIDSTRLEKELLLKVLNIFLPETVLLAARKPKLAIRRLIISTIVMAAVFIGFAVGLASPGTNKQMPRARK